jgi:hypothetical protein
MKLLLVLTLTSYIFCVKSANILVILTTNSRSHGVILYTLVEELSKNHQVTFIAPKGCEIGKSSKNITMILPCTFDEKEKEFFESKVNENNENELLQPLVLMKFALISTRKLINSLEVQDFLKSNKSFDLVIAEESANIGVLGNSRNVNYNYKWITFHNF